MYFILMFVWHCTQERLTGAAVVGDEACALLFLCGAAAHYYYSSFFFFSIFYFSIFFWRSRPGDGRWAQGAIAGESHSRPGQREFRSGSGSGRPRAQRAQRAQRARAQRAQRAQRA